MNSEIDTTQPLLDIGGAIMQLTYANMMELASRIREELLNHNVVDSEYCSTDDMARALSATAVYLYTQEGDE